MNYGQIFQLSPSYLEYIQSVLFHTHKNIGNCTQSGFHTLRKNDLSSRQRLPNPKATQKKRREEGWVVHQQYTDNSPPWSPPCLQAVTDRAFSWNTRKPTLRDVQLFHSTLRTRNKNCPSELQLHFLDFSILHPVAVIRNTSL